MSQSQALAKLIRQRWDDLIVKPHDLKTQYDNQIDFEPENQNVWCRLNIRDGNEDRTDLGDNPRVKVIGLIIAQLFTPVNTGDKQIRVTADTIKTNFTNVTASSVIYRTPYITTIGLSDTKWWQVNVTIPFEYNYIQS